MPQQQWTDIHVSARDGLKLHARAYGDRLSGRLPLLCLGGLTRNASDFHEIALALAGSDTAPRFVLCLDARGRGRSQWDRDWRNYSPLVEVDDVLQVVTACGLSEVAVLGTSRGGLLAMIMASLRPCAIAGAVLNDVGPELDGRGMARLKNYVGRLPEPANWEQAASMVEGLFKAKFPALPSTVWERYARGSFVEKNGRLVADYDPAIARPLADIDLTEAIPTLWRQFKALSARPVLTLRGEHSDILSPQTLARMHEEHPGMESITVAGHGHAPWLAQDDLITAIGRFLRGLDQGRPG